MTIVKIDPATRLEGHLAVELDIQAGAIASAKSSGMLFRGFENLLIGKDPRDAAHITQRICGVCPISHAMAAVMAMEGLSGQTAPDNARLVRNLILGANYMHSHIVHFYGLAAPSYIKGPQMPPWTPAYDADLRFSAAQNDALVGHYVQSLAVRRQAHEMGAILGGKLPHTIAFEFGGTTVVARADLVARFLAYMNDIIIPFVDNVYLPDVQALAQTYPDYFSIGVGFRNLLSYGVFDLNSSGSSKLLARGRVAGGSTQVQPVHPSSIMEQIQYSWYDDTSAGRNPASGVTQPSPDKTAGYSWLKAPRYGGQVYEVGPLARMWVNGDYRNGISVMDRHMARAQECSKIAHAMVTWLAQINPSAPFFNELTLPAHGSAIGLTEASRGALGHWLRIDNGVVSSYQIITPTCWNCSPRDNSGQPGALEKSLEGTPVGDQTRPIEALRIVQSYDPCLSCAVH
jgi:hydrogenase large subunit